MTMNFSRAFTSINSMLLISLLGLGLNAEAQTVSKSVALPISANSTTVFRSQKVQPVQLRYQPQLKLPKVSVSSKYWIAVDVNSQTIIARSSEDARIEPASMTKVMTAYVVFQALRDGKLNESDSFKPKKFTEGSRMFLDDRVEVTVKELIHGMIIQSGNDASITLAEKISGSESAFAEQMNVAAKQLGMKQTHFTNSTGLPDPNHYTTPEDLGKLAIALIRDFPEYYKIYSEKSYTYNNITQTNRNALLWRDIGADGMKTGHTKSAGYCLMASAKRGDRRIVVVTAKADKDKLRFVDSEALIHAVYDHSENVKVYDKQQIVEHVQVWKGLEDKLPVGFEEDLVLTIPKGASIALSAKLTYNQPILAPIKPGQAIGTISFSLENKPYADFPVIALKEIEKASWFRTMWHNFRLWMQ